MDITEQQARLILNGHTKLGPVSRKRLLDAFENQAVNVLAANLRELVAVQGVGKETANAILNWQTYFDLPKEEGRLAAHKALFVDNQHPAYPPWLKEIYDPPLGFYLKGHLEPQQRMIAIIGTRHATLYGQKIARKFANALAQCGFCIVSGLARGIDTAAHQGALEANGATAAILGCGVDIVYPPENIKLYQQIAAQGAVVSELPFNTPPTKNTFPMRNRLIAGMSEAVIVIESGSRGGSMITAQLAGDYGRQVFAVPGRIDQASSIGCHHLIRDGAVLVSSIEDVLEEMNVPQLQLDFGQEAQADVSQTLSANETAIMQVLQNGEALTQDQIIEQTTLPVSTVTSTLLMLELKKCVCRDFNGRYECA